MVLSPANYYTIMNYQEEISKGMNLLASQDNAIILGQAVAYPGNVIYKTISNIDQSKKLELPVFEETQMGISIGLALTGFLPISVFPRFNFLLLATNQLVNHLDKISEISSGGFSPKVIIKTMVGSKKPLHPGVQHCGNFTEAFKKMLDYVVVEDLNNVDDVFNAHVRALERKTSTLLVEYGDLF